MAPAICFHVFPRSVAQRQRPSSCSISKVFEEGIWVAYLGSYCPTPVARAGKVLSMAPAKLWLKWGRNAFAKSKGCFEGRTQQWLWLQPLIVQCSVVTPVCLTAARSQHLCLTWCRDLTLTWGLPRTLGPQSHSITVIISRPQAQVSVCYALCLAGYSLTYNPREVGSSVVCVCLIHCPESGGPTLVDLGW